MSTTFSIYRSSAGSGKTRTLAKEYLKLALSHKSDYFRHILAVTFTNKSSQEMKDRILYYLNEFASGRPNELASEIKAELTLDEITFQQRCHDVQSQILHNYSQFSISTIDAFFQKVIRSFTREAGIVGDYRLEVEQDVVMEEVVDNLIDELGSNHELTEWVVEFAKENLENEKAWDVRYNLLEFSKEIFKEEFKAIEDEVNRTTGSKGYFKQLQRQLIEVKRNFLQSIREPARASVALLESKGWTTDDINGGKNSGLFKFFRDNAYAKSMSDMNAGGTRVRTLFINAEDWPNKKTPHRSDIIATAQTQLVPALEQIISTYDREFEKAKSADIVLTNLYVFGLITDLSRKLKEYKDENNLMLLADAPKFLNGVIQDSDTPFIYEKVGSFYRNYLIDEFQDTSGMQWKNFQPLIVNGLDQGHRSLIVGDVKQAIYRWRGGDLNLLQSKIPADIGTSRISTTVLGSNFRSAENIVKFNNEVFTRAAEIVSDLTNTSVPSEVFADIKQAVHRNIPGFVDIQFFDDVKADTEGKSDTGDNSAVNWKQRALEAIPSHLEKLQSQGIPLKDIAILVRKNEEGQRIANHLLQFKESEKASANYRYDVISNESLRIDGAASVNLLVAAMQYLLNSDNAIARAQLVFEYTRIHSFSRAWSEVFAVSNQTIFENNLPDAFSKQKSSLRKLSVVELSERLIGIFDLSKQSGEFVYLQAFQDLVLEFASREKNDLAAFLQWWDDVRQKKSVQLTGQVDAAQIITIHKSKGLQFKYVILPFCSWALDHDNWQAPTLWVKTDQPPLHDAGFIPIKYSGSLEKSFFSKAYEDEKTKTFLDNLNLLYVALTRAEQGMIVTAPDLDAKGFKKTVAELLRQSIESNITLAQWWDAPASRFLMGEIGDFTAASEGNTDQVALSEYRSHDWQEKLVIKKTAQDLFEKEEGKQARINYGNIIHIVLSKMTYAEDLLSAIRTSVYEGVFAEQESATVEEELKTLLDIPQVAEWFGSRWDVRTEIPVLLPGGEEARIDRLLVNDKEAIVIDFKTGNRSKNDHEQVMKYQDILRKMNFINVTGYLLYIKDRAVVEVKAEGKQRLLKKSPAKDQLSLGF